MTGSGLPASRACVEVDIDALRANYRTMADAAPGAETAAVVKCDGYGLGAAPVARALAEAERCRAFFVAYPEEGRAVRETLAACAPDAKIFVFNGPHAETIGIFRDHALIPVLNTLAQARLWSETMRSLPAGVHIDTGMNRLGLPLNELADIEALGLNCVLAMSHLACGHDPSHPMNAAQRDAFEEATLRFPEARRSLAASGGVFAGTEYHYDLTRVGAALYGVSPSDKPDPRLRAVARLTAPVLQIRSARKGDSVGYAGTHILNRDSRLAVAALGYGDGMLRAGGNSARAIVGGASCPVVGRISMDLTVLDITAAPETVRIGDRAEFFGPALAIEDAGRACGTIGYELLTSLGARLPRRYVSSARGEPA